MFYYVAFVEMQQWAVDCVHIVVKLIWLKTDTSISSSTNREKKKNDTKLPIAFLCPGSLAPQPVAPQFCHLDPAKIISFYLIAGLQKLFQLEEF